MSRRSKNGPIRHVIALVELGADQVAGPELGEPVGPGADRRDHADRLARARALDGLEDVARQQAPAGEGGGPVGLRLLEDDLDRVLVEPLDADDVLERGAAARRGAGIEGELPVEDDVVRGERGAVVPGDPSRLSRQTTHCPSFATVPALRLGISWASTGTRVPSGRRRREGLVEDPLDREVTQAPPEVRVEQGGGVPHQDAQRAASAPPGRSELGLRAVRSRRPPRPARSPPAARRRPVRPSPARSAAG